MATVDNKNIFVITAGRIIVVAAFRHVAHTVLLSYFVVYRSVLPACVFLLFRSALSCKMIHLATGFAVFPTSWTVSIMGILTSTVSAFIVWLADTRSSIESQFVSYSMWLHLVPCQMPAVQTFLVLFHILKADLMCRQALAVHVYAAWMKCSVESLAL